MAVAPHAGAWIETLQMLHRTRDRLITQRKGLINHIRGLLAEYGVVIPVGAFRFRKNIRNAVEDAPISPLASENFDALIAEFQALDAVSLRSTESLLRSAGRMNGAGACQHVPEWVRWLPPL
ncbi:hypothetical protein [Desulfovibrio inopinatus]|uniref:hypothetical protein n=1 Tax=Desulfovibrio inopinatus TaxID=102109 RepID=UPI00146FC479|nr:hypothetical protein [Desulfovibrio inopinatus]